MGQGYLGWWGLQAAGSGQLCSCDAHCWWCAVARVTSVIPVVAAKEVPRRQGSGVKNIRNRRTRVDWLLQTAWKGLRKITNSWLYIFSLSHGQGTSELLWHLRLFNLPHVQRGHNEHQPPAGLRIAEFQRGINFRVSSMKAGPFIGRRMKLLGIVNFS